MIKDLVGNRTLVILTENFDDLVQKLGNMGEMQLHRFLKESRCCLIATSPGPVARVLPTGSPFRQGFFHMQPLQELSFEDSILLLSKIAQYQNDAQLASFLATPRGRARVRALRYLAGGNHRAYVIFAPLVARESLGELIKPLMRTMDDLTPYYNSRIAALSPEQRKIIEFACEGRHPVQTADIARSCFLTPLAASAELESLCKMGHLQSFQIGEGRYYELREPLMRLSFEVKKHRAEPMGLLLDFLRLWYTPAELKQKLTTLHGAFERSFVPSLQVLGQDWEDPRIAECCRDYNAAAQREDYAGALEAAEELAVMRGLKQDFLAQASCLIYLGQSEQAIAVYDKMIFSNPEEAAIWQLRAAALHTIGRWQDALASCRRSIELDPNSGRAWCNQASILLNLNLPNEALRCCETALKLNDADPLAWTTRGVVLAELDRFEEAHEAFSKVVGWEPQNVKARLHLCAALIELNRCDQALDEAARARAVQPDRPEAWVLTGSALAALGRHEESLSAFNNAIALSDQSPFVQYKAVELLLVLDRWPEAAARLDKALRRFAHSGERNPGDTKALVRRLLPNSSSPKILQMGIKVLLLTYRKHGLLGALANGLIECIPEAASSAALTDADACLWRDCWRTVAEGFAEFRLPLRLLDSAVRYRQVRDPQSLMDLPQEERRLLEPLVGAHIEAIA
jgi:tetratricopeptide (TPR) repeat protein